MTTNTLRININSKHSTLEEAVKAAGLDLTYNESLAMSDIRHLDRSGKVCEAFVTDDGVYYVFKCDICIINKFEPFMSVLDDSAFRVALINADHIFVSDRTIPKNAQNRKAIAKMNITVI